MGACIGEDDLIELARGRLQLGDRPAVEGHLADCPACSSLLAMLAGADRDDADGWGDLAGRSLGPYRLDQQIGAGGMGAVYRAWDSRLARRVAVKVLAPRLASTPALVARLEAEGRAAAGIAHPNVVTVHDAGSADGVPFIVTELLDGESLRSAIDRGEIGVERALALGIQLARGLAAAHAHGVVHRDLKPENMVIAPDGSLKILDFGMAKLGAEPAAPDVSGATALLTQPGTVVGTSGYLAPEQARGEPADERSDLFAVGAVLYEVATGRRAFDGASFADRLSAALRDTPPGLDAATLGDLAPVLARCLEKDPGRRFQSAEDLAWVLERLPRAMQAAPQAELPPAPAPAPRRITRRTLVTGAAGAAIGAAGALAVRRLLVTPVRPARPTSYKQLTFRHGLIRTARFTPDGGSAIYAAAWDDQPLAIFTTRLGGGGTRALPLPAGDVLAISSRGELALSLGHQHLEGMHSAGTLAVVPLEGGEPRVVAESVQDADFTPSGRELAIIRRAGDRFRLELPPGNTLLETGGWLTHARVSPDGERVACMLHPSVEDDAGDLLVCERATRRTRPLSQGWRSAEGLAWARDGRSIWFTASPEGRDCALRSVSLDGRVELIAQTTGRLRLQDLSAGGQPLVCDDSWRMRMMVRPPGQTAEVDLSLSEVSLASDLSADGRTILFGEFGDTEMASGCFLRPTGGGPALRLGVGWPLALSRDSKVIALLWDAPARMVVYTPSAGPPVQVPLGPVTEVRWARWLNSRDFAIGGAAAGRKPRIWRGSEAAPPVPLTDEGASGAGYASPDGTRVAFVDDSGACRVVPAGGGAVDTVPGQFAGQRVCGWHAGGDELFLRDTVVPISIRRVTIASGASVAHASVVPPALGRRGVDAVLVSASGDTVAYSYGQQLSSLFLMDR